MRGWRASETTKERARERASIDRATILYVGRHLAAYVHPPVPSAREATRRKPGESRGAAREAALSPSPWGLLSLPSRSTRLQEKGGYIKSQPSARASSRKARDNAAGVLIATWPRPSRETERSSSSGSRPPYSRYTRARV